MKLDLRWRILAILALLGYGAIMFLLLVLVLRNPGLLALWAATTLGLMYSAWLSFTGRGKRLRQGKLLLGLFGIAWVLELLLIAREPGNIRTIILIGLVSSLYIVVVAILRREYWKTRRESNSKVNSAPQFKKPYLIINPKSGGGRATKARLSEHAQKLGITTIVLSKGDNIEALARKAVKDGADVLGVSGGDGSIGAVAKVAIEQDLPIVVLAGGTRCHFARDLGLNPKEIVDGLAGFVGTERKIDVGDINGRIFLNNASFGLYADIVDNPDYRDNKIAVSRAVLQDILAGKKPGYPLKFRHGKKSFSSVVQILVGVNRYKTVQLLELGARDQLDKGVLQVTAITKLSDQLVRQMLKVLSVDFSGDIKKVSGVEQWDAKTFQVSGSKRIVVGVDGEREEYTSPITVTVRPGALRIFVPSEGVRQRPLKAASTKFVRRLWQAVAGKDIS